MNIVVTGGAGFIGSHIAAAYVADGHDVTVVDNLSAGKRENVPDDAELVELDVRDAHGVARLMGDLRPDVVNHHAAQTSVTVSVDDPFYDAEINVNGTLNLLMAARDCATPRFIYASTGGAVYGNPAALPVDEHFPPDPRSPYGISKLTAERYVVNCARLTNKRAVALRYPNVYGPRQDPGGEAGVVAIFATRMLAGEPCTIFGDGTKTRDYLFVSDVVEANRLALADDAEGVFNLGWGAEVTDLEIFEAVRKAVGAVDAPRFADRRAGEIERIALDASEAKRALGWTPAVPLAEGVAEAVAYYRAGHKRT